MATVIKYINPNRRNIEPGEGLPKNIFVKAGDIEALIDQVNLNSAAIEDMSDGTYKFDHIAELTSGHGITFDNTPNIDTIAEKTSGHGVIVDGVTLKDSAVTAPSGMMTVAGYYAGIIPFAVQQDASTSGTNTAVAIDKYYTALTSSGTGDLASIAATGASIGQIKKIKYVAENAGSDTIVLTPSVTTGFATCTFNAVGDYVTLLFNGTYWICIENSGCTLA